jgi:hypothetical protein
VRRALTVIIGAAVMVVLSVVPASADSRVVVHGLGFPAGSDTSLSIVGCTGVFDRLPEPIATYVSRTENGPAGTRSLKYDLAGGNAVGSQQAVGSVVDAVAGLSVYAEQGATGVAYVGYQAPADAGTNLVWVGRADLTAPAGAWQAVQATGLGYAWRHYDITTHELVGTDETPATVAQFTAAHGGDGPGFYSLGFGCDGRPFNIDALRGGTAGAVTTYDLEGFTSTTGITGSARSVIAGQDVEVGGVLRTAAGNTLPHGLLVLEQQKYGSNAFVPVDGGAAPVDAGDPRVTVTPEAHTVYRWRFAGTLSVDGSVSAPFTVDVGTAVTATVEGGTDGTPLVVTGSTTPAKPGTRALLWRLSGNGGRSVVATTRIGEDGTFRFEVTRDLPGSWRVAVSVPAGGGNLGGTSGLQSVGSRR